MASVLETVPYTLAPSVAVIRTPGVRHAGPVARATSNGRQPSLKNPEWPGFPESPECHHSHHSLLPAVGPTRARSRLELRPYRHVKCTGRAFRELMAGISVRGRSGGTRRAGE
jgi:hypothetical protein